MGSKSGFNGKELQEIKLLYLDEGRSYSQIARIIGKGSEPSVKNALIKAKINRGSEGAKPPSNRPTPATAPRRPAHRPSTGAPRPDGVHESFLRREDQPDQEGR